MRRRTVALVSVAVALMSDLAGEHWGYGLSQQAGHQPGVVYPILAYFLKQEWLTDRWEAPAGTGGPARRYYRLTDGGRRELGALLANARFDSRFDLVLKGFQLGDPPST